jgi:hypothetical protein
MQVRINRRAAEAREIPNVSRLAECAILMPLKKMSACNVDGCHTERRGVVTRSLTATILIILRGCAFEAFIHAPASIWN